MNPIPEGAIDEKIEAVKLKPLPGESLQPEHLFIGKKGQRHQVGATKLRQALANPNTRPAQVCQWYLAFNTLVLNGANRINLIRQQEAGNLQDQPHTSFQVLFRDNAKRAEARRVIQEAFGQYLVVDPTHLGKLSLRLSPVAPANEHQERGIHEDAVNFHSRAMPIDHASDGVKAFAGMMTEILAGDPLVLLVDEPEAFLHPSLSYKLGREISTAMAGSDKRLFAATHSPSFVMGCIQSGTPVNIVRLTYRDSVPTARILPNEEILRLMRNPLLRSTGVMSGLFYEFVVVTESDADRAFYQEINDRMIRHDGHQGIPNCLFLNAQNKQTVKTIIKPLRELGIPVAGIVDIDVLKDGGSVWTSFLDSGYIPEIERSALAGIRSDLKRVFESMKIDMKRDGGVSALKGAEKETATNLLEKLREYGLFVVPNGELESWLKWLGASGHGPNWLISIFEKMGEDPQDESYTTPSDGDAWEFMGHLRSWFLNQRRKGIPE